MWLELSLSVLAVKCCLSGWEEGTPVYTVEEKEEIKRKLPLSAR